MKICVVCGARPDVFSAGVERCIWCYSKELIKRGCSVHIVYDYDAYPKGRAEDTVEGIHLHGIVAGAPNPIMRRIVFYQKSLRLLFRLHSEIGFDIFSLYSSYCLPIVPLLKRTSKPIVVRTPTALLPEMRAYLHEMISSLPSSAERLCFYFIEILSEAAFLRLVDAVIVPTERNIMEFKRYYHLSGTKFHVVPTGQDLYDRFNWKIKDKILDYRGKFAGKSILLFIGGDWRRKGAINLLYMFTNLKKIIPSVLIIVSPFPQKSYISLIRRLGLEVGKDIYITGHVEDEELALLYAACDVFVLPSYHESFSVAVTEAMAFGKPVIVSPIAGDPIVEDCVEGFIIKPYDINSFTEALTTILSDRKLYNHMSEKAACKAKLYLWKNCALKLYEVYEKVLLERKTGRH